MIMDIVIKESIQAVLSETPRKQYMAELHLQSIKYESQLQAITASEICEELALKPNDGIEFSKMRNLTTRLRAAGLNPDRI